jgi:general secretion pathway protein A
MYTEYYGFTGRPFQLTPDPAFYFDSRTHRKAMAYLGYGLAQGEGFIVITGDIGAGKTTLVGHLMATIDRARLTVARLVSTQVEGDDMLRLAAQGLGLATEGVAKAQVLDRIERFLHEQARTGKRTLLIVDEAQNLPVSALEELRMLSNFQGGGQALVQIFLLGQPEFREKLKTPGLEQLRQRVIATHHLDPMSADEVGPYLEHRLALVDWVGNPRFTGEAYAALYAHTGGVPRALNTLMSRLLLYGAVEQKAVIDAADIDAVVTDLAEDGATQVLPGTGRGTAGEAGGGGAADDSRFAAPLHQPAAGPPPRTGEDQEAPRIAVVPMVDRALEQRVAMIEARLDEQEAALRRILGLLVDWVEGDSARPSPEMFRSTAA